MLAFMAEYSVLCAVATVKADLVAAAVAKGCNMNDTDQLLGAGADINATDEDGWFPLFIAAREGHTESIKALLQGGAAVDACCRGARLSTFV